MIGGLLLALLWVAIVAFCLIQMIRAGLEAERKETQDDDDGS